MPKVLSTIVGADRPGIVHLVSSALFKRNCVISELSQTTLLGQFAGLFSVEAPEGLDRKELARDLESALKDHGLFSFVTPIEEGEGPFSLETEPYVLTITGPQSPGLIPAITARVASFDANIENLRSVVLSGAHSPGSLVLVLELSLPVKVQRHVFREALSLIADELGLSISLQHRDIFEAVHRI
jgi:glycine cleavage system transcriptional repressor